MLSVRLSVCFLGSLLCLIHGDGASLLNFLLGLRVGEGTGEVINCTAGIVGIMGVVNLSLSGLSVACL